MVTDRVIGAVVGVMRAVLGFMPVMRVPEFVRPGGTLEVKAVELATKFAGLERWVPFDIAVYAAGALVAVIVVAAGIRSVRMIVSLFTGGGGTGD